MKKIITLFVLFQFQSYAFLCTEEYRPVCANGETYSNACMAKASGVNNFKEGPCVASKKIKDKKSVNDTKKMCVCPMIWKPVCGVDGKTYGSSCNARCKNITIKHQGECKKIETH